MEKCKTLGKETYYEFSYSGEILKIKYGFSGSKQTEIEIENTLIEDVIKRVKYLEENDRAHSRMATYYERPKWEGCKNTVQSPYIAKLVLDVFPQETLDRIAQSYKDNK
jgi:hypothetical protein